MDRTRELASIFPSGASSVRDITQRMIVLRGCKSACILRSSAAKPGDVRGRVTMLRGCEVRCICLCSTPQARCLRLGAQCTIKPCHILHGMRVRGLRKGIAVHARGSAKTRSVGFLIVQRLDLVIDGVL